MSDDFERAMDGTDMPTGGQLLADARQAVVNSNRTTHALNALLALVESHHSRLRAVELRQRGVKEEDIW